MSRNSQAYSARYEPVSLQLKMHPTLIPLSQWAPVLASDEYHACVGVVFFLWEPTNLTELCQIMDMVTPAYIAAARRNLSLQSGLRLQIQALHEYSLPDTLIGEIHIDFGEKRVQRYCSQRIQGMYVHLAAGTQSWRFTAAGTSQDISRIVSVNTTSIGQQENGAPEIPPDVCACVAQCLTACDFLGTCASLNAASRQVQFATLPALYRVLVWKSFSWELTSLNQPITRDLRNIREHGDDYSEKTEMWRRMINGPGAKYIE